MITFVSATAIVAYHLSTWPALAIGGLYTLCFALATFWLLNSEKRSRLRVMIASPPLWAGLILLLAVVDQHHYLKARKLAIFASSAEALERPARLLLHGQEPYRYLIGGLPAGPTIEQPPVYPPPAPISPGPGWVLLWSPLTFFTATGFLEAGAVAVALWALARVSREAAGAFLLLLLAQPIFFFLSENGADLYAISLGLVVIALLAEQITPTVKNAVLLGLIGGVIATARVPILLPMAVIGFGYYQRSRRNGTIFIATSSVVATAFHLFFSAWSHRNHHFYQPMHVFHRGAAGAGMISRICALSLLCGSLFWVARKMPRNAAGWCVGAFLVMLSVFLPEAAKELTYARALNWEGSNYITFPVPLLIAAVTLRAYSEDRSPASVNPAIY